MQTQKATISTQSSKTSVNVKTITVTAMLCAIAFAAKLLSNVIPITVAGFLEFDLKDIIIVISGFLFGPLTSVIVSVVVSLVEMVTISTTGIIGLIMNVLSSCSFACTASIVYKKERSMRGAVISLLSGVAVMAVVMVLWNYLITPLYMGVSREQVAAMLLSVFLPFNLVKGGINATLTMLLYKPIVTALRRTGLVAERTTPDGAQGGKGSVKWGVVLISLLLLATFVLLALVLGGVI